MNSGPGSMFLWVMGALLVLMFWVPSRYKVFHRVLNGISRGVLLAFLVAVLLWVLVP